MLLLGSAVGRDTLAPGLVVSKDLAFWTMALRFAGALALRQRFLPGMIETTEGWRARWTPVLDGADAKRRVKLAKAMPGACRALSSGRDQPPDTTSLEALDSAVAMLVDELAREAATSTIAARPESAHEAWLHALGTVVAVAESEIPRGRHSCSIVNSLPCCAVCRFSQKGVCRADKDSLIARRERQQLV